MNESTSSSTNGSPAPAAKPWDKDELWKKVTANNAARRTGNEGKPATQATEDTDIAKAAANTAPAAVDASLSQEVAGQHNHCEGDVCPVVQANTADGVDAGHASPGRDVAPAANVFSPTRKVPPNVLDSAQALHPKSFPNRKKGSDIVLPTIANFQYMLEAYGVSVEYCVIKKRLVITIPGQSGTVDNQENVALAQIFSLAILNGMPTGQIPGFLVAIGDRSLRNPVADWIDSRPWDGVDRFEEFCRAIMERKGYPPFMKKILIRRWLLSAVAAALKTSGFHCRGVLVLQGKQGLGKSRFFKSMVSDAVLNALVVLLGHHLDGASKDSMTTAITHWIVELGELDGTLKKDIARLKGFLTGDTDKVRRPYGRLDSEYPRRTVFGASVNDNNFLVDDTGNSRWWTIACDSINFEHGVNMQQLFAQMAVDFRSGEQWWLTLEEEQMLDEINKSHRVVSMIRERVLGGLDQMPAPGTHLSAMTAIEVLEAVGVQRPTNPQCKECASILREIFGDSKKVNGNYVWRVALSRTVTEDPLHIGHGASHGTTDVQEDLY